jgi:predicted ATP-dependent endonuclease of OLD family
MQALSFFYENVSEGQQENSKIISNTLDNNNIHSLIPKNKKDNFNDSIKITAKIQYEKKDEKEISKIIEENNFECVQFTPVTEITLEYKFEHSKYIETSYQWESDIWIKKKGRSQQKIELYDKREIWDDCFSHLCQLLPEIIYYPNFLFNFPDHIYLEERQKESREQKFYRKLLQDILDSLENQLTLKTHVIDRAKSEEEEDKDALESVINKMSSEITHIVFDKNTSVFNSHNQRRDIKVTLPKKNKNNELYLEIKLKDHEDSYYIRERSLGFRWFFIFSLFTQFRVHRLQEKSSVIFLFDEPASNLHQTAQQKLTNAFEKLTKQQKISIIFATHSHHLIKPEWLENTYIVRNEALNYQENAEDTLNEKYNSSMTDIKLEKYRSFVSNHPNKITYYQPILDILEYRPSNIENIPDVVMVEGKNDFYTLKYFQNLLETKTQTINLLPGTGSGNLDTLISLYIAWNRNFIIFLDSDNAGNKEKQRYIDKFGIIVKDRVFTFQDINNSWVDSKMEDLINKEDKLNIVQKINPEAKQIRKKKLYLALQENLVKNDLIELSEETSNNFIKVFQFLDTQMKKITN